MKERYAHIFPLSLMIHPLNSQVLDASWAKQGHVYTKVIRPWLWNDHGIPFFEWDHREVHGLQSKVRWKSPILSVNPQIPIAHSVSPTFKSCPKKFPYNPSQHYPYLPCGIQWNFFSSIENHIGCNSKMPSCKPKAGWDLWHSQPMRFQGFSSKSHGMMVFMSTCPKTARWNH